jgi:hypothetical protein
VEIVEGDEQTEPVGHVLAVMLLAGQYCPDVQVEIVEGDEQTEPAGHAAAVAVPPGQYCPDAQLVPAATLAAQYWPAGHAVPADTPARQNLPAGHPMHVFATMLATVAEYVPPAQFVQTEAPVPVM